MIKAFANAIIYFIILLIICFCVLSPALIIQYGINPILAYIILIIGIIIFIWSLATQSGSLTGIILVWLICYILVTVMTGVIFIPGIS